MPLDLEESSIKLAIIAGIITSLILTSIRVSLVKTADILSAEPIQLGNFYKNVYAYLASSTLLIQNSYANYEINQILTRTTITSMISGVLISFIIIFLREKIPGDNFFRKSMYVNLLYWVLVDILIIQANFYPNFSFILSLFLIPLFFSYLYSWIFDKLV